MPGRDPDDLASGHGLLSSAYAALQQWDRADASHRALLALRPKSPWVKGNYAAFLVRAKRLDDAITHAKAALALMDYGMARDTLRLAYRGKAAELRQNLDEKGANKYDRLADAVAP